METAEFMAMCQDAIVKNDLESLKRAVYEFSELCFSYPTDAVLDDGLVSYLSETFRSPTFHAMEGSWHLIRLIEEDWSAFTEEQRLRLLDPIEFSYNKYADWMSCFMISEILGDNYCCERAFEVLRRLSAIPEEVPRSLIPHGFEHIAQSADDPALRELALAEIHRMRGDVSEQVRDEALISLGRLGIQAE